MAGECLFCTLISQEKILKVYENDTFVAFLDINPRAKGHTIIAPKEHTASLTDLSGSARQDLTDAMQVVAQKASTGLGADGVSFVTNVGEVAGQRIPHFYVQVFPRYQSDENAGMPAGAVFQPIEMDETQIRSIASNLADASLPSQKHEPEVQQIESETEEAAQEVRVGTPSEKVRAGTEYQQVQKEGKRPTGEEIRQRGRELEQQSQESQKRQERPRFTTVEEVPEEYPNINNVRVERGVDLKKYDPKELEITARIHEDYAEVDFREKDHRTNFTVSAVNEREIVHHIAKHFKLDPELVAEHIEFERTKFEERSLVPTAGYEEYDGDAEHTFTGGGESRSSHERAEFI